MKLREFKKYLNNEGIGYITYMSKGISNVIKNLIDNLHIYYFIKEI